MNNQPNKGFIKNPFLIILVIATLVTAFQFFNADQQVATQEISYSQVITELKNDNVSEITYQPDSSVIEITGTYKEEQEANDELASSIKLFQVSSTIKYKNFKALILPSETSLSELQTLADEHGVKVTVKPESTNGLWFSILLNLVPLIIFGVFFMMMMNQGGGGARGAMNFGRNKAKALEQSNIKVRFSDVAGAEEEKQELVEVVEFLKDPKRFTKLGARIPAGVLLEGPPGTGKTLLAKAVAGEAGVPFFSISGSDFVEMFVGVGASRVRSLFEDAKKVAPAIIFIDEIDAVGRQRGVGMGGGNDEREQTLNQLLIEMDGFEGNEGIIVIAATNRSDVLDPALLRPGRFDRKVLVGRPDVKGREAILKVHAKNKPLAADVDLKLVAQQTPGFVGADLENVLNEAALVAARRNKTIIDASDIDEAEDRVIAGPSKKDRKVSAKEREIVAYHEAGHTIVGLVLSNARVVHKVTIIPRGRAGGYMIALPKEDQMLLSKDDMKEQLAGLMGGRVAEEIIFNTQTTGASNDFEQATQMARAMVAEYGMSEKMGPMQYEGNHSMFGGQTTQKYISEQTAYELDNEVRDLLNEARNKAADIIQSNREKHKLIAEALLKYETLDSVQIKSLYETGKMPEHTEHGEDDVHPLSYDEIKNKMNDQ
ncbi:ATP-dependent zinc metalloprotease FtsH [Streptococcus parasuis]|uniref:ATP-dependent zinc metalloprotease FtsH n=1 Tax=Streptococcus parasuis TaxID=1501662 RepID=A0A4Q8L055_9STRE|nr:ATP-dependent zinc metalloprotease FtsH [Streptococcus parasuis]TAA09358.1 ATP-dependent metallopeptidase FtsH/Yme1/Tma family protein [Streptococcus parasuis]